MRVLFIFILTFCLCGKTFTQLDTSDNLSRLSILLETGILPVHSENAPTLTCYQGQLGLAYRVLPRFHVGLYGQTLFYYQNLEISSIDDKIIEMGSIDYHTFGLFLAYRLGGKKIIVEPKLDIGYSIFNAKSVDYDLEPSSFLDYRYLSLAPKLNLHYKVSESFSLGIYGGYNLQLTALKGEKTKAFDPSSYVVGVSARVFVIK